MSTAEMTANAQLLTRLTSDLKVAVGLFSLVVLVLTMAMLVDFTLGITKAKLAGRKIQSFRARKSALKTLIYYGSLMMGFHFDLLFIIFDIYDNPYLSFGIGAVFVLIEIKSWFEKLSDKEQARIEESAKTIAQAWKSISSSSVDIGQIVESLTQDEAPQESKR